MPRPAAFFAAVLLWGICAGVFPREAAAQFVEGKETTVGRSVRLARPADTLLVTYRPTSSIARTDTLVGARAWTPSDAGVVKLATLDGSTSQNVSVRFRAVPASGLFVLLAAGLILFGGAGYALRKLLGENSAPVT